MEVIMVVFLKDHFFKLPKLKRREINGGNLVPTSTQFGLSKVPNSGGRLLLH